MLSFGQVRRVEPSLRAVRGDWGTMLARVLGTPGPWLRVRLDPGGFPGGSLRTGPLSSPLLSPLGPGLHSSSAELHSHVVLDLSPRKQLPGTRSTHARPGERAPASLGVGLPVLKGPRVPRSTSVPESPDSGRGRCREEGLRAETGAGAPAPGGISVTAAALRASSPRLRKAAPSAQGH